MAAKKADFNKLAERLHMDPVIIRILRNRDLFTEEEMDSFLHGTLDKLHDPHSLKDAKKAALILKDKIQAQKKIRIIGDYDVDGICSTYILYKGLLTCKAQVDAQIPHRIKDGYGINEALMEQAYADGVDTILTCDNGIAAKKELELGKEKGMTCIVTDHHEVPFTEEDGQKKQILPNVDAIVDPKQEDCSYPFPSICGAVVAYKVIQLLFEVFDVPADTVCKVQRELLELAGIATVCDIMPLRDENRILVKTALEYLKDSHNPGIRALIAVNELDASHISSFSIGFVLGPCINATGRLDSAKLSLELLQAESFEEAVPLATSLKEYNENRKAMTEKGVEEAMEQIDSGIYDKDRILVLYLENAHESLAGIIAGRVRERTGKPTFVLTKAEEGIKGSARSIEAYNVYEEMTKCSHLFTKFGGHKMAAGLSLPKENVEKFRTLMNDNCTLTEEDFEEKILIDVPMPMSYVNHELLNQLSLLEPFGNANEKPVFAQKDVIFLKAVLMGKKKNMARITVMDENGQRFELVLFRDLDRLEECLNRKYGKDTAQSLYSEQGIKQGDVKMDIIYYPSLNEFRGRTSIQYQLQDFR